MTYLPTVKRENLVAFYPFSEGSGSTAYDYSSDGNDGAISGAVYIKIPSGGYALDFDGSNDYVTDLPVTNLQSDEEQTVSFWIKTTTSSDSTIIGDTNDSDHEWLITVNKRSSNVIEWGAENTGNWHEYYGSTTINDGEWHHIVVVFRGTGNNKAGANTVYFYVDGLKDTTNIYREETGTWTDLGSSNNIEIGRWTYQNDQFFDGKISNVTIYNVALTAEEVKQLYKQTYIQ